MSLLGESSTAYGLIERLIRLLRWHRNPFRRQAARVLSAFAAHDVSPTQIARLLPEGLLEKTSVLASPESLQHHMSEPFLAWVQDTLQLERPWIDGSAKQPHQRLDSYKRLNFLQEFLAARITGTEYDFRFVMHVFKSDDEPLGARRSGSYVVVLEETFAELDDKQLCRFYYLTHGGDLDYYPGLLHLLQIMAVASFYRIHVWGRVMKPDALQKLDEGEGLIPSLWRVAPRGSWHPEDPLWLRLTGDQDWNARVRKDLEVSLQREGMQWLVDALEEKRLEYAACRQGVVTS